MRNLDESAFSLFRKSKSNFNEQAAILKRDGYLVLDHLVGTSQVNEIIEILNKKISNYFQNTKTNYPSRWRWSIPPTFKNK